MPKVCTPALKLFHDFEAVFFDHRIRQNLFGDALEFFLRFITVPAIQIQDKEFSLTNFFHLRIPQSRQSVVNGLPLRVQHGALRHYPNMCFHAEQYNILPQTFTLAARTADKTWLRLFFCSEPSTAQRVVGRFTRNPVRARKTASIPRLETRQSALLFF